MATKTIIVQPSIQSITAIASVQDIEAGKPTGSGVGFPSSGLLGNIQFSDGNSNFLSDDKLKWDNVNFRFGVGISTPTNKLHVFDDINPIGVVFGDSIVSNRYQFTTGGNSGDSFLSISSLSSRAAHQRVVSGSLVADLTCGFGRINFDYSGASFTLRNIGVDHFVCRENGDIGIGTSNFVMPAKLSIQGVNDKLLIELRGNSLQTSDYFRVRDFVGNILFLLDNNAIITSAETTTPAAIPNFMKVYSKNDNKLYFQDGSGAEHEVQLV